MNKSAKICILIAAVLLAAGIGGSLYIYTHNSNSTTACIYQDGTLIKTIDLSSVTEPYTFEVTGENGAVNTISVRQGEIAVIEANCPDKVCVHMGYIKNDMLPITCLPNKLVIKIESPSTKDTGLDGLSR